MLAAARSGSLWTELFRFLVRQAETYRALAKENEQQVGYLDATDDGTEERDFVGTAVAILRMMGNLCIRLDLDIPDECEGLVVTWTRANIFGMMDEIIPLIVFQPGVPGKWEYL